MQPRVTEPAQKQRSRSFSEFLCLHQSFATRWLPGLLLGPIIYLAYRQLVAYMKQVVPPQLILAYDIPVFYGLPALLLLGALLLHRKLIPSVSLFGRVHKKHLLIGLGAVLCMYIMSIGLSIGLGYGREFGMANLGFGKTAAQFQLMIVALLILPPIVEEIMFRHFLLGTLPFMRDRRTAIIATFASALIFMYAHFGAYSYWPTHLLMFSLGVLFAQARLRSGGLLLPVILHCFAIGTALIMNYVWGALETA